MSFYLYIKRKLHSLAVWTIVVFGFQTCPNAKFLTSGSFYVWGIEVTNYLSVLWFHNSNLSEFFFGQVLLFRFRKRLYSDLLFLMPIRKPMALFSDLLRNIITEAYMQCSNRNKHFCHKNREAIKWFPLCGTSEWGSLFLPFSINYLVYANFSMPRKQWHSCGLYFSRNSRLKSILLKNARTWKPETKS